MKPCHDNCQKIVATKKIVATTMGLEPTIFRFEVERVIHYATRPLVTKEVLARHIPDLVELAAS